MKTVITYSTPRVAHHGILAITSATSGEVSRFSNELQVSPNAARSTSLVSVVSFNFLTLRVADCSDSNKAPSAPSDCGDYQTRERFRDPLQQSHPHFAPCSSDER